jgi:hypothetical protein
MKKSNLKYLFFWLLPIILTLFLYPSELKAQEQSDFNYSIDTISLSVKVQNDLTTQNEVDINNNQTNGISTISWTLPTDASQIKVIVDNQTQKYDLVAGVDNQFIVFTSGNNNQITYDSSIPPEQKGNLWDIFLPITNSPHIYVNNFQFTLTLPEGASFVQPTMYLVHNFETNDILSQNTNANQFTSQLKIEPNSIASFDGQTTFNFQLSIAKRLVNFVNKNFLVFALSVAFLILAGTVLFLYSYLIGFGKKLKVAPPASFLEKSYLTYKKITSESIAATIMDWGIKGFINLVEKENGTFILGKTVTVPKLDIIEQKLWDYLFAKGNLSLNLKELEKNAENAIIPKEILDLENLIIQKLDQDGFITSIKSLGFLGLNNLILILSLIALIALAITSWLANESWIILPAIVFNLAIIAIGENIPLMITLTAKGKQARGQLQEWKQKLSEQITQNLTFETLIHNLAFLVFFSLEEKIEQFSQSLPVGNYDFFTSYNPNELPVNKIKKILTAVFTISRNLNKLKEL